MYGSHGVLVHGLFSVPLTCMLFRCCCCFLICSGLDIVADWKMVEVFKCGVPSLFCKGSSAFRSLFCEMGSSISLPVVLNAITVCSQ